MSAKKQESLSLSRKFAAAAIGLTAGVAASYGVNETMTMIAGAGYTPGVAAFFLNFGALFAMTGAATAYAEHKMRPAPKP